MAELARAKSSDGWIDPDFNDDVMAQVSDLVALKIDSTTNSTKNKRKRNGNAKVPSKKRSKSSKDEPSINLPNSYKIDEDWLNKYVPLNLEDLAVTKDRPQNIIDALRDCMNSGSILLLSGPSGCGKTTCLRIVAKQLDLNVLEWQSRVQVKEVQWKNELQDNDFSPSNSQEWACVSDIPQRHSFINFLVQGGYRNPMSSNKQMGTVLLVKDIPNIFVTQPTSFPSVIQLYMRNGRCPLVFIMSDMRDTQLNIQSLFPPQTTKNVVHIEFAGVANTKMKKVLLRICEGEGLLKSLPSDLISNIVETSHGDLRTAITCLQLQIMHRQGLEVENNVVQISRDYHLKMFSALGKFLYGKREDLPHAELTKLPPHLYNEMRDYKLKFNPEFVLDRAGMSNNLLSLFLHHNYLPLYRNGRLGIENCDNVAHAFSLSDSLPRWTSREIYEQMYGAAYVGRIIAHNNVKRDHIKYAQFKINSPYLLDTQKQIFRNTTRIKDLFGTCSKSIIVDLLPFMAVIPDSKHYEIAKKLGRIENSEENEENMSKYYRKNKKVDDIVIDKIIQYDDDVEIDDFSD